MFNLFHKAGQAVDQFIEQLLPLLEAGDIIIDGGNSERKSLPVIFLCSCIISIIHLK